ncbi:MAG: hypothetical protein WC842_04180 [Candidatus Paceibacterota bacterium]|jgi:hypothetical protein
MELTKIILYSLGVFILVFILFTSIGFASYRFKKSVSKSNISDPIKIRNNDSVLVSIQKKTITKINTQFIRIKHTLQKRMTVLNKQKPIGPIKDDIWKYYQNKDKK